MGIDFGTYHAAALSDGTVIDNPRFMAQSADKIKVASKQKRRKRVPNFKKKIKASKRWKKASKKVSRLQGKVTNQRQDWTHKIAAQIVSSNSRVATEELNLKGMTRKAKKGSKRKAQKTGLNRSILDVGIGNLISAIEYKLQEAGGFLVFVPTKTVKPSQTCPDCGHQRKKDLSQRVHYCSECGATYDRDVAAAMVMLSWALGTSVLTRGEEIPTSVPRHTGGWKQISSLKRQKLAVQRSNG
jgi:IS605 OrfB family transposase